jgi:hypothetical protein
MGSIAAGGNGGRVTGKLAHAAIASVKIVAAILDV